MACSVSGMTAANILILIAAVLIGARLTRLITADVISEPLRDRITTRLGYESKVVYFVHCPWCVGLWVAVILAVAAWLTAPDDWPITAWWGIPGVAALMAWVNGLTELLVDGEE